MPFLAPLELADNFSSLRDAYQRETDGALDHPQPSFFSKATGAHDVTTRGKQINLLQVVAKLENPFSIKAADLASLKKQRLLVGLAHCIQRQILNSYGALSYRSGSKYGKLYPLINKALNLSSNNELDDDTLFECLNAVTNTSLDSINEKLNPAERIDETLWRELQQIARKLCPKKDGWHTGFPATDTLAYVGKRLGGPPGYAFGYVVAEGLGRSAATASVKYTMATVIGGAIVYIGGPIAGVGAGAAYFLARQTAERAVNVTCGIAGAVIAGEATARIGQAAGMAVGFTIDMAYMSTSYIVKSLSELAGIKGDDLLIGTNLCTGQLCVCNSKGEPIDIAALIAKHKGDKEIEGISVVKLTAAQTRDIEALQTAIEKGASPSKEVLESAQAAIKSGLQPKAAIPAEKAKGEERVLEKTVATP